MCEWEIEKQVNTSECRYILEMKWNDLRYIPLPKYYLFSYILDIFDMNPSAFEPFLAIDFNTWIEKTSPTSFDFENRMIVARVTTKHR